MAQKRLSIKEFQDAGYLQEVNRLFFHPLGLALAIERDNETQEVRLSHIIDSRDDPEGFVFDFKDMDIEGQERALHSWINVTSQAEAKSKARIKLLGTVIEAIPGVKTQFDMLGSATVKKSLAAKIWGIVYTVMFITGLAAWVIFLALWIGSYFN